MINHKNIEAFWPLTNVKVGSILKQTNGRFVCQIDADEGMFVCKSYLSRTEEKIVRDTYAFDFLRDKHFRNIPKLLKTKEDKPYKNINGRFVYIMEFVKGQNPSNTVENWKQIGEILANLHNITNYPYKTLFTTKSEILKCIKSAGKYVFRDECIKILNQLPNFDGLSQSLIHTDIGLHNIIQNNENGLVLIDWDDAGIGTTILDLGFPIISQFVTPNLSFDKENATAFYNAYFEKRKLSDQEKKLIFDASLFFSLIYIPFGNINHNWQKIKFVLENKEVISSILL